MQLKIQFNVSKGPTSPPEPAPFDPVKIRNFLLLIITLLSLIGFGVYSIWFKEPTLSLPNTLKPNTLNSPINAVPKTDALNKITAQQSNTKIVQNTILTSNTAINGESNTIHAQGSQNNILSHKSSVKAKTILANTSELPAQKNNRIAPEQTSKQEIQNLTTVTPTIVNKVKKTKAELLIPKQAINQIVHRAQLTSNILSREPIDKIEHMSLQKQNTLYFFTEIHLKNNQKIFHRWIFKKNLIAQITLNIRNTSWRTYSSKNFDETMIGQWEVQVVDSNDNILKTVAFNVLR